MASEFDVFISYRRSDAGRFARNLRRALQEFRLPKALASGKTGVRVYLDTIYERAAPDFYENVIRPALLDSKHLLLVATPDAADRGPSREDWIRREIEDFERGPNAGHIAVVIGKDLKGAPLPGDIAARYPNIQIIDLRGLGALSFVNPIRSARLADELAKIIATLLDVRAADMPLLRREQERQQQVKLGILAGATSATIAAVAILSGWALKSRNDALDAISRSAFATDRVIQSVARSLAEGEIRTDLLTSSCDLLDSLKRHSAGKEHARAVVTCSIERAASHDRHNEPAAARQIIQAAVDVAEQAFLRSRSLDDAIAVLDARRAAFARHPGTDDRQGGLHLFLDSAKRLSAVFPTEAEIPASAADMLQAEAVNTADRDARYALALVGPAVEFRRLAESRAEDPALVLEHVVALALKAELHSRLHESVKSAEAIAEARAAFQKIFAASLSTTDLRKRHREVATLLEQAGGT